MMIDPNCGYFNKERDDEYVLSYGECEECYRYDICRKAQIVEELLSGNIANINLKELHSLVEYFPDRINTLMIQKSSDDYCVVVDDISVRREQTSRGAIMNIEELTKIEEQLNQRNVYIISSVDNKGTYVGRFKGLSLDADNDLIIRADIDSVSCTE